MSREIESSRISCWPRLTYSPGSRRIPGPCASDLRVRDAADVAQIRVYDQIETADSESSPARTILLEATEEEGITESGHRPPGGIAQG